MIRRFLLPSTTILFAVFILVVSIFNASELSFNVPDLTSPMPAGPYISEQYYVQYDLPVATATPLPVVNQIKAASEKFHVLFALTNVSKAQTMLDLANNRMVTGERYIREGKIDAGLVTISKGQEYMEGAFEIASADKSYRSTMLLKEISMASLKHRERLEGLMFQMPDQARTFLVSNIDRSKLVYNGTKIALISSGETPPRNPFEER